MCKLPFSKHLPFLHCPSPTCLSPLPWAMFTSGINLFLLSRSSFQPNNLMVITQEQFSCLQPVHSLPYLSLNLSQDTSVW